MRLPRNRKFIPSSERHPSLDYQLPALLRNFRLGMTIFTVTFFAATAYVIFWFAMAALLKGGLNDLATGLRDDGYRLEYTEPVLSGFPFNIRFRLDNLKVSTAKKSGSISSMLWTSNSVIIAAHPWRLDIITISLKTPHNLTLNASNGKSYRYVGDASIKAVLNFDIGSRGPVAAEIKISDLDFNAASRPYNFTIKMADIMFTRNVDKNADYKTNTLDMRFVGKGLEVPEILSWPLGHRIESLILNGAVLGPVGAGSWPDRLAAWRDIGGTLEIAELDAVYGPMKIKTSGTMALDKDLQPIGAFNAKVEGFFKTIDTLKRNGLVRAAAATTAKLVLGVLAQKPKNGGTPSLNMALTAQDRKLFAGPVLLIRIPEINWRAEADVPAP